MSHWTSYWMQKLVSQFQGHYFSLDRMESQTLEQKLPLNQ